MCDKHVYLFATEGKDCPYCRIEQLEQELAEFKQWQKEDHDKLVQQVQTIDVLEQEIEQWKAEYAKVNQVRNEQDEQLSRYAGAVEVEGYVAGIPTDIDSNLYFASGWSKELSKFSNQQVKVLVMKEDK